MWESLIAQGQQLLQLQMPVAITAGIVALFITVNVIEYLRYLGRHKNKRGKMIATSVRHGKRRKIQDRIHDMFFDLWCEDVISKDDYMFYTTDMATRYQFPDLMPRRRTAILHPKVLRRKLHDLKKNLKQRKAARDKLKTKEPKKTAKERLQAAISSV